jgi:hypothetical protein
MNQATINSICDTIQRSGLDVDELCELHGWLENAIERAEQNGRKRSYTLYQLLESYISIRLKFMNRDTKELFYGIAIRNYSECLGHTATLGDLTTKNVLKFVTWLQGQPMATQTRNARLRAIRALLRFAVDQELIRASSCCEVLRRDFARICGLPQERKEVHRQAP